MKKKQKTKQRSPNTLHSFWQHEGATGQIKFCGLVVPVTMQNRIEGHNHFFLEVFQV